MFHQFKNVVMHKGRELDTTEEKQKEDLFFKEVHDALDKAEERVAHLEELMPSPRKPIARKSSSEKQKPIEEHLADSSVAVIEQKVSELELAEPHHKKHSIVRRRSRGRSN